MERSQQMLDAAKAGDLDRIRALLDAHPSLASARNDTGESAILLALYHGHPEAVELLLAHAGLDIFEASATGQTERVARLLAVAEDLLNSYSYDGWTPLHLAAFFGHAKTAQLLISRGANLEALSHNSTGNMPLHAAIANHKTDVVELLISSGANVNARAQEALTPLHQAAFLGDRKLVEWLITRGADVNARNQEGKTPLDMAREKGRKDVVEIL